MGEAAEYSWMTPVVTVRAVRAALELGDAVWALRMVLQGRDHLRRLLDRGVRAAEAWEADPGSTGAAGWDQLLGALVGREFEARQQQPPAWTFRSAAGGPWLFESPFFDAEEIRAQTPVWLAERGVLIASRDLGTA